jgi:hypothetical protein
MTIETCTYPLRLTEDADDDAVIAILRSMIGESVSTRWTREFWDWKHRSNPSGRSYGVCAIHVDTGEIASVQHAMRWDLRTPSGEEVRVARPCDGATYPQHQRKGIYATTDRFLTAHMEREGALFCFGTPNDKTLGMELKTGWSIAARFPLYVRPLVSLSTLRHLLGSGARGRSRSAPEPGAFGLMRWSAFGSRFAEQFSEVVASHERERTHVGYRTPRDVARLHWRYGAHPTVGYGVHVLASGDRLDGFLVARPTWGARGLKALVVTDLFHREPSVANLRRLVRGAIRGTDCHYLQAHFAEGTRERRALWSAGFFAAPKREIVFTVRPLLSAPLDPARADVWDFSFNELELF